MNTNEQAPECCPFCGADLLDKHKGLSIAEYKCQTVTFRPLLEGSDNREEQSEACADAERERLTRERDGARAEALVHLGNLLQAQDERDAALARVKDLESEWSGWTDLQREWFGGKYAAMQPWGAVRARIEDTEARIKGIDV